MQITKAVFDQIAPGEIFRVVTTRIQDIQEPMDATLTFVCVKAREGHEGTFLWAIYAGKGSAHPNDVARYGHKIKDKDNILSICPCDEEVLQLYRQ